LNWCLRLRWIILFFDFQSRLALAIELKNEGNIKYREQKFTDAIEAYTSKEKTVSVFI
jgi:hypothetical protein